MEPLPWSKFLFEMSNEAFHILISVALKEYPLFLGCKFMVFCAAVLSTNLKILAMKSCML